MLSIFQLLFSWLPEPLYDLVFALIIVFAVWLIIKIIQMILDLIPFV